MHRLRGWVTALPDTSIRKGWGDNRRAAKDEGGRASPLVLTR
jgi:hypothetical protein